MGSSERSQSLMCIELWFFITCRLGTVSLSLMHCWLMYSPAFCDIYWNAIRAYQIAVVMWQGAYEVIIDVEIYVFCECIVNVRIERLFQQRWSERKSSLTAKQCKAIGAFIDNDVFVSFPTKVSITWCPAFSTDLLFQVMWLCKSFLCSKPVIVAIAKSAQ